jgi:cellulose biosynthesis protein BcsQ
MVADNLFVVAVASEKGGVGKTTIATNLAVYLKALEEDLPVTIASFDNHFSVDNMFAIGRQKGESVAGLFTEQPAAELALLGEYGVQFLASERQLNAPADPDPGLLRRRLSTSGLTGVLIIDTRPILDYFTRSALQAADLVLAPVKDRASLVNAASIRKAIGVVADGADRLWLVPSLIDGRLKLKGEIGMRDFLVFSGQERGYQMVDTFISKSPKVEGLASGFSSRIHPVLTHARTTAVHRQMRDLANFVLQKRAATTSLVCGFSWDSDNSAVPAGRVRRLVRECPVCGQAADGAAGQLFFDRRSRRRGFVHADCFVRLLEATDLKGLLDDQSGMLALSMTGSGLTGDRPRYRLCLYDADGNQQLEEVLGTRSSAALGAFTVAATGRLSEELFLELLVFPLLPTPPGALLLDPAYRSWRKQALNVARDLQQREL